MPRYCDYIQLPDRRKRLCLAALTLAFATLALTACATLSESECQQVDWEALGEKDGALGYPPERIADHREACTQYGITPDADAYARGRLAGLDRLCTAAGGLAHGRAGRSYQDVCPRGYEEDFYEGFRVGRRIYDARSELERVEDDIDELEFELRRRDIDDNQRQFIYYRLTEKERDERALRRELARLDEEARELLTEF